MLPWWVKTDRGFWVSPSHAGYSVARVSELCWKLSAMCMACGHGRMWSAGELVDAFPPRATIGAIALRLKCGRCGSDQGRVDFMNDRGARHRRDVGLYEARLAAREATLASGADRTD